MNWKKLLIVAILLAIGGFLYGMSAVLFTEYWLSVAQEMHTKGVL